MFHIDTFGTQCGDPRRFYLHQGNPANYACISDPQKLYLTTMCEATNFKVLLESKGYPRQSYLTAVTQLDVGECKTSTTSEYLVLGKTRWV